MSQVHTMLLLRCSYVDVESVERSQCQLWNKQFKTTTYMAGDINIKGKKCYFLWFIHRQLMLHVFSNFPYDDLYVGFIIFLKVLVSHFDSISFTLFHVLAKIGKFNPVSVCARGGGRILTERISYLKWPYTLNIGIQMM